MNDAEVMQEYQIPANLTYNALGIGGLYKEKVHLSEKSIACNDLVIIKILEQEECRNMRHGFYLPDDVTHNTELIKGIVMSCGPDALRDNISVGNIVLYDRFSAFYNPPLNEGTFIITKIENVIVKLLANKTGEDFIV